MKGVVGHHASPNEIPKRVDEIVFETAGRRVNLGKEGSAVRGEIIDDRMARDFRRETEQRQMVGEIQRDAAIAIAERLDSDPNDLSGRTEHVEIGRTVILDPRRQNLALEN